MKFLESRIQRAVISWFKLAHRGLGVPHENLLFAIPNGGQRSKITASILKAEGVRAGVSDLFLAIPRGKFHGMFIELKIPGNTTTDSQDHFLGLVSSQMYYRVISFSFEETCRHIEAYLRHT